MKEIKLRSTHVGKTIALVDDEDFEHLSKYKWYVINPSHHRSFYAVFTVNKKIYHMHRMVMKAKKGQVIDHIDGNGLNNQKSNLRICTLTQNKQNRRSWAKKSSKYKGVSWDKTNKKWHVMIYANKNTVNIGRFIDEQEAAIAYNNKAKVLHGEFARLNIIPNHSKQG